MPIFEYRCRQCKTQFEKLLFRDRPAVACPACGHGNAERRPSAFGMGGQDRTASACGSCSAGSCAGCGSGR